MRYSRFLASGAAALAIAVGVALMLSSVFTSQATQAPRISLDMVTSGNAYDESTNMMTVGTINECITSPVANPVTHNHNVHLVIENVEDLIGWQARLNYLGDQMRPNTVSFTPFLDNSTGQNISFVNLPIDQTTLVHRGVVSATDIPPSAAGPQSAVIGSSYIGIQDFAISPDTPAKAAPDDSSYSAPSGGILSSLSLQVVGDHTGSPSLFVNLDNASPNAPGSGVAVFDGAGTMDILLGSSDLGDGYHGEGATCVPLDCVNNECPLPTTPTPTATATATPTPTDVATPTPTSTATPTPTASPSPTQVHNAAVVSLRGSRNVRLAPGVADSANTIVVAQNLSDHSDQMSVYLAFNPPGGFGGNPGGCSAFVPTATAAENAAQVYNWTSAVVNSPFVQLSPGEKITLNGNVEFTCTNPAAVDGDNWQVLAIVDVHGNDSFACNSQSEVFDNPCSVAINDDDADDGNNTKLRPLPKVIAQ